MFLYFSTRSLHTQLLLFILYFLSLLFFGHLCFLHQNCISPKRSPWPPCTPPVENPWTCWGFSGAAVALQHAQELAATAAEHLATGTLPDVEPLSAEVPDESQGYQSYQSSRDGPDLQENAEKGKRSMVQMRWNSFENPFNMDVTWGRKGEGVKNVKDVKDGGAAEVSQSSQSQTAEGSGR